MESQNDNIVSMLSTMMSRLDDIDKRLQKLEPITMKSENVQQVSEGQSPKEQQEPINKSQNRTEDEIRLMYADCIAIRKIDGVYVAKVSETEYPFADYVPDYQELIKKENNMILKDIMLRQLRNEHNNMIGEDMLLKFRKEHNNMIGKLCIQIQPPLHLNPRNPDYLRRNVDEYFRNNFFKNCSDNRIYAFDIIHFHINVKPELVPIIIKEVCDMLNGVKPDCLCDIENHICDKVDNWCWDIATELYEIIRIDKKHQFVSEFTYPKQKNGIMRLQLNYSVPNSNNMANYKYQGYVTVYDDSDTTILGKKIERPLSNKEKTDMSKQIQNHIVK